MADYRNENRGYGRDSSIFSDDDEGRWRGRGERDWDERDRTRADRDRSRDYGRSGGSYDRRGGDGDRGFFERAGDTVRSWFGDDDAEHRRERESGERGSYHGHEDQWTGERGGSGRGADRNVQRSRMSSGTERFGGGYGQSEYGRGAYGQGDYGRGDHGRGRSGQGWGQSRQSYSDRGQGQQGFGQSEPGGPQSAHQDEAYRRWRDQQIQALDREYDEYCQHRQKQFETDFHSFRQTRQSGSTAGAGQNQERGQDRTRQMGSSEAASGSGLAGGAGSETEGTQAPDSGGNSKSGGETAGGTSRASKSR